MATIVITGSNSGFGRLTAETLAKAGHTVFATMRGSTGKNAKAAAELKAFGAANGNRVHVVELDVTSDASVQQAIGQIAKQTGGVIDVLFNNAGRFSMGIQEAFSVDEVKSLFETNVFGPLRVNRAVLPHMRKRRSGLIITTSSIAGRISMPCFGTYAASKHAVEALADAQRDELKELGIDVVLLEPGAYPTPVGDKGLYTSDARADEYGTIAELPRQVGKGLGELFTSPNAPKPQD
ncbi:MAG TPA: SDR family oxidoreductase, partial [Burkholderiales bacterium]|nr:SDR family oxidoreductase [Burkholderiales bacterium]